MLSKRTDFDGPATGLLPLVELDAVGCTAIVRAMAVFCFFLSRAVGSSPASLLSLRLGGIVLSLQQPSRQESEVINE